MSPSEERKAERWAKAIIWISRICRWIGYVAIYFLMVDAPAWGWGLLLAIIMKRTFRIEPPRN